MVSNLWEKSTRIVPKDLNIPSCVVSFYPLTVFKTYLHMVIDSRSNIGVRVCKQSCHPRFRPKHLRNSLLWQIYIINCVDETKLSLLAVSLGVTMERLQRD